MGFPISLRRSSSSSSASSGSSASGSSGFGEQVPTSGWSCAVDEETGETYYFHRASGQVAWELPVGVTAVRKSGKSARRKGLRGIVMRGSSKTDVDVEIVDERCESPTRHASSSLSSNPLSCDTPTEWRTTLDQASGEVYYFNRKTGETSWEFPAELLQER
jgi:outer membrane protein assembly factor BamB